MLHVVKEQVYWTWSNYLKEILKEYDKNIEKIEIIHGPEREGDIPHSLASIEKAKII